MSSQLLALLVCFIFVSQSSCSPYQHDENKVLCGSRLVKTMTKICEDYYNSLMGKKAVNWNLEGISDYRWLDNDVNSFIPLRHQIGTGIAQDCCDKPCSIAVLRSHCPIWK